MLKSLVRGGLLGAAALTLMLGRPMVSPAAAKGAPKGAAGITWSSSLTEAQKSAAKSKKVIMVDFGADWCGPCKKMLATTYKDKSVVAKAKNFVPVLIDIDKQAAVARKYNIEAVPTVIFMDAKGKVLARTLGYQDAAEFVKTMNDAQKKAKS
jgi:thiol:disulfide interchange protein